MQKVKRGPVDRVTLDCEPRITEGSIDEIVVSNCNVHLERMDDNWYYLGIYDEDGLMMQFSIHAHSKKRVAAIMYGDENTDGIHIQDDVYEGQP